MSRILQYGEEENICCTVGEVPKRLVVDLEHRIRQIILSSQRDNAQRRFGSEEEYAQGKVATDGRVGLAWVKQKDDKSS